MSEQNNKGIFTKNVKIIDASVQYTPPKESWQKRGDDILLTLTLDVGNAEFQPELVLRGYFNKQEDGSWKNNGTATKIKILFDSVGVNWDNSFIKEDYELTDSSLEELSGKEFCKLSYVWGVKDNGKSGWNAWTEVAKVGDDQKLKDKFLDAVKNKWVRDYRPNASVQQDSSEESKVGNDFQL